MDRILHCCGCGVGWQLAAAPPTGPLAWEPPYAAGETLKKQKDKNKQKKIIPE